MANFRRFFAMLIVAIVATIMVLPAEVEAGAGIIAPVKGEKWVVAGGEFEVQIEATAPIYGATLRLYNVGARVNGVSFLGVGGYGSRPGGAELVLGFAEPTQGVLATVFSVASGVDGDYTLSVEGEVTGHDLSDVEVNTSCIIHVRTLADVDGNGIVDAIDAMDLANGIVGWADQPIWSVERHPEGDLDANRRLDHMDVVHLLRQVLGLPSLFEGVAGKVTSDGNSPEVVANAHKALADLSSKEGPVADQLREMILQLVPEVSIAQPTAVESTTWGAIKSAR